MANVVRWAKPGYGGTIPRLEINGVLHSRMFEIGDLADMAHGDTIANGRHPICYHVMDLFRQQNPGLCTKIDQGRAKQWGWYVPVSAEAHVEKFAMDKLNRQTATGKMFGAIGWMKKQKRLKEEAAAAAQPSLFVEPPVIVLPDQTAPAKSISIKPQGRVWTNGVEAFRGYDVNTPVGRIITARGRDQFVRLKDIVKAADITDPKLNHAVVVQFHNKIVELRPTTGRGSASHFFHDSALTDCLDFLHTQIKRKKQGIIALRNILGVAA